MTATIYIFYMLIIHPLVIYDGYFGAAKAKTISLVASSALYVLAQMIEFATGRTRPTRIRRLPMTVTLCAFALLILISTLLSVHKPEVFTGYYGWWNGAVTLVVCILAVIMLSLIPEYAAIDPSKACIYAYIGVLLPSILAVTDAMGADIFGWRGALEWSDRSVYTSTAGNYAWLSSMLMCAIPLALKGYRELRERSNGGLALLCDLGLLVIFMSFNVTAADISLVTLFICVILQVVVYAGDTSERRSSYLIRPFFIYCISAVIIWLIFNTMENAIIRDGILQYAARGGNLIVISVAVLLVVTMYALIADKRHNASMGKTTATGSSSSSGKKRRSGRTVDTGIRIPTVPAVILSSLISLMTMSGLFLAPFVGDEFGGSRGYMWHTALSALRARGIKDILFGSGPDTFYTIAGSTASADFEGQTLTVAHNVFLNVMINIGLIAAIVFVFMIFLTSYNCLKKMKTKGVFIYYLAAIIGTAAFFAVGYINSVMLGILIVVFGTVDTQSI